MRCRRNHVSGGKVNRIGLNTVKSFTEPIDVVVLRFDLLGGLLMTLLAGDVDHLLPPAGFAVAAAGLLRQFVEFVERPFGEGRVEPPGGLYHPVSAEGRE